MTTENLERAWNAALSLYRPTLSRFFAATGLDRSQARDPFRDAEPTLYVGNNLFVVPERRSRQPQDPELARMYLMVDASRAAEPMRALVEPLPRLTIAGVPIDASAERALAQLRTFDEISVSASTTSDLHGAVTGWSIWAGPLGLEYRPTSTSNEAADSKLELVQFSFSGAVSFTEAKIEVLTS